MKDDHIQHIINLYLTFHKAIPNAARMHFHDLDRLLTPVIGKEGLEHAVANFFSDQNRRIIRSESSFTLASSVRLIGSSRVLTKVMTKKEKALFVGVLLKLLRDNERQENKELLDNVAVVADILNISKDCFTAMKNFFFDEEPLPENFATSLMLTHHRPDYNLAVEGLRYAWHEKLKLKAWMMHLHELEVILVKIVENDNPPGIFPINKNDVFPFQSSFRSFLELKNIDTKNLLEQLEKPVPFLPLVTIAPTELTPRVLLDPEKMLIELTGQCLPVAAQHFFAPVFRWIERLQQQPPPTIEIHVNLNYFNTYSSKILLEIFFKLKRLEQFGTMTDFFWYYQQHDEELRESGEYYEEIVKVKFHFIEMENSELNVATHE